VCRGTVSEQTHRPRPATMPRRSACSCCDGEAVAALERTLPSTLHQPFYRQHSTSRPGCWAGSRTGSRRDVETGP
jgi:hypothetical protein